MTLSSDFPESGTTGGRARTLLDGQYIVGDTVGTGGFGKVKVATHVLTGEKVAIKIIDKKAIGEDLPRVQTELKALKELCHQNICRLFQATETEDKFYFILEFCAGGELFDYIVKKECLPEPEARHFFRQIVSAIAYVHNMGFAHRDLKPENLLLTEDLQLKVIDFGLCANPQSGLQKTLETCCGSPAYAAPELVLGKEYLGHEADIWSMGVLLYALLCGFLPFETENENNYQHLYQKITAGKYVEPPWLSEGSKKLLKDMLQVDPKRRIRVDKLLTHPWVVGDYSLPLKWRSIYDKNLVDEDCAKELACYYRTSLDEMMKRVKRWDYDHVTVTYFLLLSRKKRRCPIMLPLAPRSPRFQTHLRENRDNHVLLSPTIHASLESGLDKVPFSTDDEVLEKAFVDMEVNGYDNFNADIKSNFDSDDSYSRAIASGAADDGEGVTPVSKKIRKRRDGGEGKENDRFTLPPVPDFAPPPRPRSVYTTPHGSVGGAYTPHHHGKREHRHALRETHQGSQETPVSAALRIPSRDESVERGRESGRKSSERTPRSKTKTPTNTTTRRMFASVERKVDRVINLLTPKRQRTDGPARLDRTKQTLVNVSSTSCSDPQVVLDELLTVFKSKGITCEHQGWKIHGKAKDRQGRTCLTLELEVVFVEHLNTIGIKRKRLNGDAFMYKRVCEDILSLTSLGL